MSLKKRPAPLNLDGTKCVPGTLQTPKHLAQDITMQCLSPTLPRGISPEMLKRSQEIEAQQRQLIVQRGICAYDRDGEGNDADCEAECDDDDDDDQKSSSTSTSTPTSANTSSSSSVPGVMVEGEALPPHLVARSVPASATSATSRRPWELGNPTSSSSHLHTNHRHSHSVSVSSNTSSSINNTQHNTNKIAPHSATVPGFKEFAASSTSSSSSSTLRAGGTSASSTLQERRGAKPISLDVNALKRDEACGDPESKALDEEDEMPTLPSSQQYMTGLMMGKKRKFMDLCSEMWDLLHS